MTIQGLNLRVEAISGAEDVADHPTRGMKEGLAPSYPSFILAQQH